MFCEWRVLCETARCMVVSAMRCKVCACAKCSNVESCVIGALGVRGVGKAFDTPVVAGFGEGEDGFGL